MRIIIDGTVGCGKTSVILGESQRDSEHKRFLGLADLGYPVFTDLVINVIKHMRNSGINDPSQNWDIFFKIAVQHCINNYNNAMWEQSIFMIEASTILKLWRNATGVRCHRNMMISALGFTMIILFSYLSQSKVLI